MKTNIWITAFALGLSLVAPAPALAQGKFPDGTMRLVVPFAAGGGVDQAAPLLSRQLQTDLGINVIVENRAGASGTIGGKAVQTAPPDGMTLLFSAATHVLAQQVLANPPYDPQTDFAPVARGILEHATVRSPLLPLAEGAEKEIAAAMRSAGLAK